jgi:mannose-6-phosphate isomerase-like protein (cupin superfamily)
MALDAPQLLGPGEGETIRPNFEIKVSRPELVVTESRYRVDQRGPDPHVHHHHADSFWVLEGELVFEVGPQLEPHRLGAGGFVLVPPDVLHSFHNPGPAEARFLNLHAPGLGFDEYLRSGFEAPFDQYYMPAGSGRPADGVLVLAPGEGGVKADADDGIGSLGVVDVALASGSAGPAPYARERALETFYVLEGVLTLRLGERETAAPADSCAVVPPGQEHTFSNPGPDPVRLLCLTAPAEDLPAL